MIDLVLIRDDIRATYDGNGAVSFQLDFALREQGSKDICGVLVVLSVLLSLDQLLLQLPDLILLLMLEDVRQLLDLHLLLHVCLRSAPL